MSLVEKLLGELIDKLHLSGLKKGEESQDVAKAGLEKEPMSDSEKDADSEETPRIEALKELAGEQASQGVSRDQEQEEGDEEEMKPILKHNHSVIKEECGPGCPMHDSQAK